MSIHRKLTTVCCVAVLALGLAACASNDDDMSMTDPTTMEPTAVEQLANAQAAVADAQTMVAALTADDSSPSDRAAAYAALAAAQSVLAEASGIPENEIALLRAEIARLQGDIDQAKLDAQVEAGRIADEMAAEATRIAALVAGTATAETKRDAIGTEAKVKATDDEGLGGTGAPTSKQVEGEYNLAIKHGETSITVEGTTADDDVKFALAMDFGGGRTMHVREIDADDDGNEVTEVVIVATDITVPKAVAFAKWETMDGKTPQELNVDLAPTVDDDDDGNAANDFTALKVKSGPSVLVKSDAFKAGTAAELTYFNDDTATAMDEADEVAGTYNGAMGTYRCNGINYCKVTLDAKGAITMSKDWIFIPAMGATSDQLDYDYLHYGSWLQKTADEDGVLAYDEVQTFAGSSVKPSGKVVDVEGSATYNGGATGVYVHSEINSDGSRVATTAGQFAADATLTATFGQVQVSDTDKTGTIAPSMLNTVTGSISNFELEHNEANTWAVNLKGTIDGSVGTAAGSANGGGREGSFSATFHGPTGAGNDVPSSVVGEFGANLSNGSVAGAFGARK